MPARYDRRAFLQRAAAAGALGAIGGPALVRNPAEAQADESLSPFLHGVASGDPLPDGVILWTRVSGQSGPVEVRWTVARDLALTDVVSTGTVTANAERDHTVKVDVRGLEPGCWYFYRFEALGACSLTGRTKTAPSGGVERLRFGVASCSSYQHGFFNAYARLAERDDLDAVLHLGDYVYEYAPGEYGEVRDHEPPVEMVSLEEYRGRYAQYRLDPDLRRLHQLLPMIATWDDHESTDNSWRDGAHNHNPEEGEGDWAVRKAISMRVYEEWMPIRVDDPAVIYRSFSYGDLLDIVVLDTRLEGRDEQVGTLGATIAESEISNPDRQLISADQRRYLFGALSSSTARWRFIAQQVMVGQLNAGGLPNLEDLLGIERPDFPGFRLTDGGNALNPDQWDGYLAERRRLLDHIAGEGIGNVVVLTGDIHSSWAIDLTTDPYDPATYNPLTGEGSIAAEIVTTSVTSEAFEFLGPAVTGVQEAAKVGNPHIKWVDLSRKGYTVLDVTPERVQAEMWVVDTILERSTGQELQTSWQVLDGRAGVQPGGPATSAGTLPPATPEASPACVTTAAPEPEAPTAPSTPSAGGTLPATGGAGPLAAGAALLGGAALAHVVRRRATLADDAATTPRTCDR
jgi:alkaline phosphatase D